MSQLLWHQTWTNQVEYGQEGHPITPAVQESQQVEMEAFAQGVCDYYQGNITRVPSGRAWQISRNKYMYDYMTCRLAKNSGEGDGHHDGDIGGGQYLNACVWYEILTRKSCLNNTYRPTYKATALLSSELNSKLKVTLTGLGYTLNEELVKLLQNSAHAAVASTGLTVSE